MKALGRVDLYTGLILLCLVLLPVCGWWCWQTNEQIDSCIKGVRDAKRDGGLLEQIGSLQKKVEIVNQNRSGGTKDPRTYFEGQILAAAANRGLNATDFGLDGPKEEPATIPGSKQRVSDFVMTVDWKRKDLPLKLDFIEALLWNCESGAGLQRGQANLQSIWRLRHLEIVNMTDEKKFLRFDTPPPELEDRWTIKQMKFARREPKTKT